MSEQVAAQVFREAAEGIPVGQPPVADVVSLAAARRRRRTQWTLVGLAVAVGVVGLGTWVQTRPSDDDLPDVTVRDEENPANVEWYANGVLHLSDVAVEMPRISQILKVPDGVVVADRSGRVVQVEPDGELRRLGVSAAGSPLVGSRERGWVAWVEPGSDPSLVVHDTVTRHELASIPVEEETEPIAIDQARLYYSEDGETWSWQLPDFEPVLVPDAEYLDVAASVRVRTAAPGFVELMEPLRDVRTTLPGENAVLSADADYLLTNLISDKASVVRIYDVESGEPVPTGIDDDEHALAAAFGPNDTITYVVGARDHGTDGDEQLRLSELTGLELRTCDLLSAECQAVLQYGDEFDVPVLPSN